VFNFLGLLLLMGSVLSSCNSPRKTSSTDTTITSETTSLTVASTTPAAAPPPQCYKVPIFCQKNTSDLPNIIEEFNKAGRDSSPQLEFVLDNYDTTTNDGSKLAVVLALASTDRVDIVDRELLDNLRANKGFSEVIMIILRRGSDASRFKESRDPSINSGVGREKALIQLIYFNKQILDADSNRNNIHKFFELAKKAFPN